MQEYALFSFQERIHSAKQHIHFLPKVQTLLQFPFYVGSWLCITHISIGKKGFNAFNQNWAQEGKQLSGSVISRGVNIFS